MTICLPAKSTEERKQLLRAYGADLIEVDGGPNDAIAYARHLVDEGHGYMCYQYGNPANPASHEFGTSLEIRRDWPLDAPPDHLFCAYGTGGTLTGNSRAMKRFLPRDQRCTRWRSSPTIRSAGMRSQEDPFQPPVADLSLVDRRHQVGRKDGRGTWS